MIDTDEFSQRLRVRSLDPETRSVRLARLAGSEQEQDLTSPTNAEGYGRVRHFRRETSRSWPPNPLPIHPAARALGLAPTALLKAQVFQNATCNWRCWYCYVPFELLSGNEQSSDLVSVTDMVGWTLDTGLRVLDLSGGQPDLAPEWILWTLEELDRRNVTELYVWSDDNLSNDYLYRYLDRKQLSYLAENPRYGRVGCFKGFDDASFAFNTAAAPELFDRQFDIMARHVREGFDVYAYTTFTGPTTERIERHVARFVDRLQEISTGLPLRTVPLEVLKFSSTDRRLRKEHDDAMSVQQAAIECWQAEMGRRFTVAERNLAVTEVSL
jgi:uncharacterized Fe-S cluster-containing radical SAM superfamily protein